jgi:hypothetical protein
LVGEQAALSTGPERVASTIEQALRSGSTRSELRELVDRYSNLARLVGVPLEVALARLDAVATRVSAGMSSPSSFTAVGDSVVDRRAMMARWCSARYQRAD